MNGRLVITRRTDGDVSMDSVLESKSGGGGPVENKYNEYIKEKYCVKNNNWD